MLLLAFCDVKQEIRRFLSKIGTKGGKAGTGEAKRHGRTSEDYRRMVQKRWSKKK